MTLAARTPIVIIVLLFSVGFVFLLLNKALMKNKNGMMLIILLIIMFMINAFGVGLIFLDHRFTIPNFPSRLLSYMQSSMPVLACTDANTDVGKVITDGGFGWWCESNSTEAFTSAVDFIIGEDLEKAGENGLDYLKENYTAKKGSDIICACVEEEKVGAN